MITTFLKLWACNTIEPKGTDTMKKYMNTCFVLMAAVTFYMVSSAQADTYLTHGDNVDMKQAFSDVSAKAEQGNAKAQFDLGQHYVNGEGVEQNEELAFKWTEKAANQNLAEAEFELAKYYLTGTVVGKDIRQGISLLTQSANQGVVEAHIVLGRLYTRNKELKNYAAASLWLTKAADLGSTKAMDMMALIYLDGRVVEPDNSKAAYWLQRGSDAGDLGATYSLADFYMQGTGVAKDKAEAIRLLKYAAEKGHQYSIDYFVEQAKNNDADAIAFLNTLPMDAGQ